MTTTDTISPSDELLIPAARQIREANPALGVTKVLQQLKAENPTWAVSEKRLKKIIQSFGPAASSSQAVTDAAGLTGLVAETGLDPSIDIAHLAPKVKARLFGGEKGKGLVAREKIWEGEVLWQEEPWIVTADPDLYRILESRQMCAQCFTMFNQPDPPLSVPCTRCNAAQFCNRLCLSKAQSSGAHLDVLCPGQNPGAAALQAHIRRSGARHLDAAAKIIAKWRTERDTVQDGKDGKRSRAKEIEKRVWGGMARINLEKKEMERKEWELVGEPRRKEWTAAHALVVEALNPPPTSKHYKQYQKLLASRHPAKAQPAPLTEEESKRWFSFDSFLELLGLASINQEDSGGLYALHAHINHSCEPNLMARNLPKDFKPPTPGTLPCSPPPPNPPGVRGTNKLTIVARRTIHPGDELTLPYVDFRQDRDDRRQMLRELYGFWCYCSKCQREEKAEGKP